MQANPLNQKLLGDIASDTYAKEMRMKLSRKHSQTTRKIITSRSPLNQKGSVKREYRQNIALELESDKRSEGVAKTIALELEYDT